MKKIFISLLNILLFLLFIWININSSFAYSGQKIEQKQETIQDLKKNIEVLKSKKVIVFSAFQKFKIENWNIKNFFSKNLKQEDLQKIEQIIRNYNEEKQKIKLSRENVIEKLLILEKRFYISLLPYIDQSKINLYKEFVQKAVETIKNSEEIKNKIKENKIVLSKKVSKIKKKIKQNNIAQESKLNNLLRIQIKLKIDKFKNSKKIQSLPKQKQKLIFKFLLQKIKNYRKKVKHPTNKQLKIYSIIEQILIDTIKSY